MHDSSDFLIRQLTSADIANVRALHDSLLPIKYPTSFFLQLTLLRERVCLVAYHPEDPTNPIAFISAALQQNPRVHGLPTSYVLTDGEDDFSDPKVSLKDAPHIEILTLGVLPAFQQRGVARLLVRRVHNYFSEHSNHTRDLRDGTVIHTNVATSNAPALSFYERMGLKVASGVIRNLYRACPHGSKDGYLLVGRIAS
ncbi:hypothetical protein D9615_002365 [Tricholomella constricta]|uniref:N-alpha-acetyltransferase 60 n=1 Tax=Tricholomella constricta TaxID=117010 RepID=A0A8H5HMU6_9AGAR|nr:hypothetical protein D9615_002365 [Tricholomella constricta]